MSGILASRHIQRHDQTAQNQQGRDLIKYFIYPATLPPDEIDGSFVVTSQDLPKAITQGDTIKEALDEAADCIKEAIAARMEIVWIPPLPAQRRGFNTPWSRLDCDILRSKKPNKIQYSAQR